MIFSLESNDGLDLIPLPFEHPLVRSGETAFSAIRMVHFQAPCMNEGLPDAVPAISLSMRRRLEAEAKVISGINDPPHLHQINNEIYDLHLYDLGSRYVYGSEFGSSSKLSYRTNCVRATPIQIAGYHLGTGCIMPRPTQVFDMFHTFAYNASVVTNPNSIRWKTTMTTNKNHLNHQFVLKETVFIWSINESSICHTNLIGASKLGRILMSKLNGDKNLINRVMVHLPRDPILVRVSFVDAYSHLRKTEADSVADRLRAFERGEPDEHCQARITKLRQQLDKIDQNMINAVLMQSEVSSMINEVNGGYVQKLRDMHGKRIKGTCTALYPARRY